MGRAALWLCVKASLELKIRNEKCEMVVWRIKNMEAPRNFDSALRRRHRKRSRGISIAGR